jgi:hypothetical protein
VAKAVKLRDALNAEVLRLVSEAEEVEKKPGGSLPAAIKNIMALSIYRIAKDLDLDTEV